MKSRLLGMAGSEVSMLTSPESRGFIFWRTRFFVLMLVLSSSLAQAVPIYYADRVSFIGAVGLSITDGYTGYTSTPDSSLTLTDAEMSAVLGEATYEALTFPNRNSVGDVFGRGDGSNYCAGCNGNFRLGFDTTSFSDNDGVFGVGLDIVLHTSRRVSIGDDDPSNPTYEGSVEIQFADGLTEQILIPADIGYYEPSIYFLGITDERSIASITIGTEPLASRHFWVIDNLTVAASTVPIPPALYLFGSGLLGLVGMVRRRKQS